MRIIDVSNVNGSVDFAAVKKSGVVGVYVKATEGASFDDPNHVANKNAARKAGLKVGSYHFARPDNNTAAVEAAHFLKVASPWADDLLPVLDLEHPAPISAAALSAWATAFMAAVAKRCGGAVLYTYPAYWTSYCGNGSACSKYPLWLASYGVNDGKEHTASPVGGWGSVALHQFTSNGSIPGVRGRCDVSSCDSLVPLQRVAAKADVWTWMRWRLGEGEFEPYGQAAPSVRPAGLPKTIPASWWLFLRRFLAKRNANV